jgi:hypothetical protein
MDTMKFRLKIINIIGFIFFLVYMSIILFSLLYFKSESKKIIDFIEKISFLKGYGVNIISLFFVCIGIIIEECLVKKLLIKIFKYKKYGL